MILRPCKMLLFWSSAPAISNSCSGLLGGWRDGCALPRQRFPPLIPSLHKRTDRELPSWGRGDETTGGWPLPAACPRLPELFHPHPPPMLELWKEKWRSSSDHRIIKVGKVLQDPWPIPTMPIMSPSATSPQLWDTSRDGDSASSLGSCANTSLLFGEKIVPNIQPDLPWHNLRLSPLVLLLLSGSRGWPPPHHNLLSGSCWEWYGLPQISSSPDWTIPAPSATSSPSRPPWRASLPSGRPTLPLSLVSSANLQRVHSIPSFRWSIKILNRTGNVN